MVTRLLACGSGKGAALLLLAVFGCRRTPAPARPDVARPDVVLPDVTLPDVAPDVRALAPSVDASTAPVATRRAVQGPWRAMLRIELASADALNVWDAPPDLDGDGLDDGLRALLWDPTIARCASGQRGCPGYDDVEHDDRAFSTVAFALALSGDAPVGDGGRTQRLVGLRRIGPLPDAPARSAISSASFAEFGPAVMARVTVDTTEGEVSDQADVVDLFVGAGLDRHAGAVVHHCARVAGHAPIRSGTVAVALPAYAPLVWRAALAHPFSSCEAPAEQFDQGLGATLAQGVTVTVAFRAPVETQSRVEIARAADRFVAVEASARRAGNGLTYATDLSGFSMTHGCYADRLEYRGASRHHCRFELRRDDAALPGCLDGPSALDPTAPVPVALLEVGDAGPVGQLVFARGGSLFSAALPADCRAASHRVDPVAWQGALPEGGSASPDGRSVLFASALDLWLSAPGHRVPVLMNAPGGVLPRGTVRAIHRVDATHAAAVISRELVVFSWTLPEVFGEPESDVRVDEPDIRRALRSAQ